MRQFGDGIFVEEGWIRFYGFRLQTRMAVVLLEGGRLLLYAPVPLTPAVEASLQELGEVAVLLAPNKIHNQTLAAYRARYPSAMLHAAPGLPERRPDLRCDVVLGDAPDPAWRDELDLVLTDGNGFLREALLHHRRSRTLLVTDLVEQLGPATASPAARAVARAFGVGSAPVAAPEHRFYTFDAEAARRALARARAWPFERIFLCHGALITRDAQRIFADVADDLVRGAGARRQPVRWLLRRAAALQ